MAIPPPNQANDTEYAELSKRKLFGILTILKGMPWKNFFASFFVVTTVSLFSGFTIQYVLIAAGLISIFTVIMNFLFQRNRREYKYFSTLTTQIYLFDYLVSFLFALYFVDVLNLINGLF